MCVSGEAVLGPDQNPLWQGLGPRRDELLLIIHPQEPGWSPAWVSPTVSKSNHPPGVTGTRSAPTLWHGALPGGRPSKRSAPQPFPQI